MRSRFGLTLLMTLLGLAIGLFLAFANPDQYGRSHHCPSGASRAACSYPPDVVGQRVKWGLAGAFSGLLVGAAFVAIKDG